MEAAQGLAYVVFWFVVVTLAFSLVGLILAILGAFTPVLVFVAGGVVAATLGAISWVPFYRASRTLLHGGIAPVLVIVFIVVVSGISAGAFSAEHVLTNRDPGVYVTTAKWLANEGTLLVDGAIGGFEGVDGISAQSLGYYEVRADGLLNPQFMHLLPIWGAAAQWIGGDQALLRVNAVIIAGAIGAFWLFAALLVRPWLAVLATAGLAVNLVTVHFARDMYSEPLALMLIFASLFLLVAAEHSQKYGLSLVTGILVGATAAARIDAWLVVIAFAAYLEFRWVILERRGNYRAIGRFVQPVLVGMAIGGSISFLDGFLRSAPYISGRGIQFFAMMGLLILVLVGGSIARTPLVLDVTGHEFSGVRKTAAWLIPVFIGVSAALLFFVRPVVQETHGARPNSVIAFAQTAENLTLELTRSYAEWSMRWLSWYLGIGGLAVGVAGLITAWRRALLGCRVLMPFLLTASLTTAVFILRPSIVPDQLWSMRRFLPVTIPALILGGVLLAEWGTERWRSTTQRWSMSLIAAILLVLIPASFAWPLRTATSYRGMYELTLEVCDALPERSALLLVSGAHVRVFQAAVRSFCGVPVAGIYESIGDPAVAVEGARIKWAESGVTLYVGDVVGSWAGTSSFETQYEIPELVLTRRPESSIAVEFGIEIAPAGAYQLLSDTRG